MTGADIAAGSGHGRTLSWRSRSNSSMSMSDSHSHSHSHGGNSNSNSSSSWWTSAVELSSSLASKMDQVVAATQIPLDGLTLPWQVGAKEQPKSQLQRGSSFTGFSLPWKYNLAGTKSGELPKPIKEEEVPVIAVAPNPADEPPIPVDESPKPTERTPLITTDVRSLSRVGESRRQTKRMAVDLAPAGPEPETEMSPCTVNLSTVSREFLLGEEQLAGSAGAHSLEGLQRQQFWTPREARTESPRVNPDASIRRADETYSGSSRRSAHQSGRSLSRIPLFEEPTEFNAPHTPPELPGSGGAVPVDKVEGLLPKEEIFPGNTNSLAQLKFGKPTTKIIEPSSGLCKHPVLGGSSRVVQSFEVLEEDEATGPASLPTSPRCSPGESRASKFLRRLKLGGRGSRVGAEVGNMDTKSGKRNSFEAANPISIKSRDPGRPENGTGIRAPANSFPGARKPGGNNPAETPEKKSGPRWLFKWRWGLKASAKASKGVVSKPPRIPKAPEASRAVSRVPDQSVGDASPTAEIMSDARETFLTKSDRFSSTGSAEKLAAPRHKRGLSWGSGTTTTLAPFTPSHPRLPTRDAQELLLPPRRLLVPTCNDASKSFQEQAAAAAAPEAKASGTEADAVRSSTEGEIFEDCHGSFRSVESPTKSLGSFRSIESPSLSSLSVKKRSPSMEEVEWAPALQKEQQENTSVGDRPALCPSPLKCPEIEHFNSFLGAQKKRLLSGLEQGNTDRFCIVLSGTDLEVSSMVAALCYAWLQENTIPKVTGDTWHAVPMIDIPRHHMHKHKDAAWLFDASGIEAGSLLFADEVELASMVGAGRIKMSIIGQDVLVTRNEVGSVCTLLAETLLAEAQSLLQPRFMKSLLLAGILLDTEDLDFASMRDTEMTTMLQVGSVAPGRTGFFNQLRQVEDDTQVSELVTRNYNEVPARPKPQDLEAEQEHSDKESVFTHSQDQTSTSEAGTSSSLDEDSPRPSARSSFKYSKLTPLSAPARSHRTPSTSGAGCSEDAKAVAHIRKAATQFASSGLPLYGNEPRATRSSSFTRIRKKLFLYEA